MSDLTPPDEAAKADSRQAFVAFSEKTTLPLLRVLLPRGFRHCCVVINDGKSWVSLEPLAGHSEIIVHDVPADFDLPRHLREEGLVVVPAVLRRDSKAKKPRGLALFTCVESVKRVIGLREFFVLTPTQLYNHLLKASAS